VSDSVESRIDKARGDSVSLSGIFFDPPPANDVALDKKSWTATASAADGTFLFSGDKIPIDVSAANAIDGDHWTGWRDWSIYEFDVYREARRTP
jgi:hypothetical protein